MSSHEDSCPIDPETAWNDARVEDRIRRDDRGRAAFEDRAVRHVLRGCGGSGWGAIAYIESAVRDLTDVDSPQLTFAQVNHFLTDFPFRLGVARLYHLQDLTLAELFRRPTKTLIYRAFREWAEEDQADDDRHRGLIFRLPAFPGNGNRAVLHTGPAQADCAHVRLTFTAEEDDSDGARARVYYTLEPLDQLLTTITHTYRSAHDYS